MTIDTLDYVDKLVAAGIDRKQAEAHARALRDTVAPQLATRADLDLAVARLEAKMDALAARFEMALWKRTAGIIVTLAGPRVAVSAAVVGILLRFLR
jgi:hypothetical protein